MPKVAVVILNYNGLEMLKQFLPTVIQYSQEAEVIVADNASKDESVSWLKQSYPQTRLIEMSQNKGFAGGYNEALKKVIADYYILLNSDVEVGENWINPVIEEMHTRNWVAAQPKILAFHSKDYFEYAGACGGYLDKYAYAFCRGRIFDTLEKDEGQYERPQEVFWATGACLFIKSDVFHESNGFDEDFFAHMEEIDLCWRINNKGLKIGVVPQSKVFHVGGATLNKSSSFKTYLNFRNSLWMMLKNLPKNQLYSTLFIRLVLDGIAAIQFLLKGEYSHYKAVFNAHMSFYKGFKKNLSKRKQNTLLEKPHQLIFNKSIIIEYFIKKQRIFSQYYWESIN